ncbi:MAG TPA: hypothetical protein PKI19_09680 [Elusimicrobiales bacterium]|nr:hypothetical protein [Elusimicrobiales bacterium]
MKTIARTSFLLALCLPLAGCFGGLRALKVNDFTEKRVADLTLTKKVSGKRDFLFFSTTKLSVFLDGDIQGIITDYQGNPIEGVTVKIVPNTTKQGADGGDSFAMATEENTASVINFSFSPGITDSMGLYKIHFSVPLVDDTVDMRGKLVYNPGWDQQKINLGKAYEPQQKETPFRLYYNMDTGFLAFAEGIRKVTVEAVGEGKGRMQALPGGRAPAPVPSAQPAAAPAATQAPAAAGKAEEDLFKGFDFGQ